MKPSRTDTLGSPSWQDLPLRIGHDPAGCFDVKKCTGDIPRTFAEHTSTWRTISPSTFCPLGRRNVDVHQSGKRKDAAQCGKQGELGGRGEQIYTRRGRRRYR